MPKLSKVSFFLFVTIYNYLWLRIILFSDFYNYHGKMGFYYALIIIAIVLLFIFLIPKKMFYKNYYERFKKSYFRIPYVIVLVLECVLGISFCAHLLYSNFIRESNYFFILFSLAIVIGILSYQSSKNVMEIATLFCIMGYLLLAVSLCFYPTLDGTLLLPITKFDFGAIALFSLMILGDNFSFLINKNEVNISKLSYAMAIFVALAFFCLEYVLLICNSGEVFFKGLNWVGFVSLSIKPVTKYIGNFDFAYIYYIIVCCIFKYAFNLSLVKESFDLNSKRLSLCFSLIIIVLGILCFLAIPMNNMFLTLISILLIISFAILFWFIKECYFVRQVKE